MNAIFPEIVIRAIQSTVTDIGQLSKDDHKTLEAYVKAGCITKGRGGSYPTLKTVYAAPDYDFAEERKIAIRELTHKQENSHP